MTELTELFQSQDEGPQAQRYGLCREEVDALFQRLVIDARSLLPHCEIFVARMLFEEWIDEHVAQNTDPRTIDEWRRSCKSAQQVDP